MDAGEESDPETLIKVARRARREIMEAGEGGVVTAARRAGRGHPESPTETSGEDVDLLDIAVGPGEEDMDEGSARGRGRGAEVRGRGRAKGRGGRGKASSQAPFKDTPAEPEERETVKEMEGRGEERVEEEMASEQGGSDRGPATEEVSIRVLCVAVVGVGVQGEWIENMSVVAAEVIVEEEGKVDGEERRN